MSVPAFSNLQSYLTFGSHPSAPQELSRSYSFPTPLENHARVSTANRRQFGSTGSRYPQNMFGLSNGYDIPPASLAAFEAFEDCYNTSCIDEYANEINEYMRLSEINTHPNTTRFDEIQTEITWKHRKSLLQWIIQIHNEFDLKPETLYLCVNLIDRECCVRVIGKSHYQLLGLCCLWIAAKFEENHGRVPSVKSFCMMLSPSVKAVDFSRMEKIVLSDLKYDLGHTTAEAFLKAHCKALNNVSPLSRALARFILEVSLLHRRFRPFRASLMATASLIMADSLHFCRVWRHSDELVHRILNNLEECVMNAPIQLVEKYKCDKFLNISIHVKKMTSVMCRGVHQLSFYNGVQTPPKDEYINPPPAAHIYLSQQHAHDQIINQRQTFYQPRPQYDSFGRYDQKQQDIQDQKRMNFMPSLAWFRDGQRVWGNRQVIDYHNVGKNYQM